MSVDLPQPDGPTMQRNSRRCVSKPMSLSATVSLLRVSKTLPSDVTFRMTSRDFSLSKRARTSGDCSR